MDMVEEKQLVQWVVGNPYAAAAEIDRLTKERDAAHANIEKIAPMRRPTPKQSQAACDRFNKAHQIGSKIWVAPGSQRGRFEEVEIVTPGAYILGGHTPVVQISGRHGCIALSHVRVRDGGQLKNVA